MIAPLIHLNGSSAEALKTQIETAGRAVEQAIEALVHASPHGRDYYPLGHAAITTAVREHQDRLKRLTSVLEELHEIYRQIVKQERS